MNKNPTSKALFLSFFRLGLTAFGGPAMVAHIGELATRRHPWLDEADFKNGVALCQSIPGATAMQTAAYVGLRVRGIGGALAAYLGFGLPAFVFMLILSIMYARFNDLPEFIALFSGLQVIVIAIILLAVYSFGRNIANNYKSLIVAFLSALAFWEGVSPFIVIVCAAVAGMVFTGVSMSKTSVDAATREPPSAARQIAIILFFFLICFAALYFLNDKLFALGAIMLKIDIFAFGGGFASLPLMLHEIVINRAWLDSRTFMDGIALGQVTPGPIVITAAFVGYLVHGLSGTVVATIAIFMPSFFMVVIIAPVFDRLKSSAYFMRAADGVLASFVGLLLFVCVKFATTVPWDMVRIMLAVAALVALIRKVGIPYIMLAGAIISVFIL